MEALNAREGDRPAAERDQLGTVCDVSYSDATSLDGSGEVDAFLGEHAHEHRFVMSYPEGTKALTGYKYEPWHWRYVGREAAERHRELEEQYGRRVSTHEFVALALCAFEAEVDDWEVEEPEDASDAKKAICAACGASACQGAKRLLRCDVPEPELVICEGECVPQPAGVDDTCG